MGGGIGGTYIASSSQMAASVVGSTQLASNAVTSAKITDSNVTLAKAAADLLAAMGGTPINLSTYNLTLVSGTLGGQTNNNAYDNSYLKFTSAGGNDHCYTSGTGNSTATVEWSGTQAMVNSTRVGFFKTDFSRAIHIYSEGTKYYFRTKDGAGTTDTELVGADYSVITSFKIVRNGTTSATLYINGSQAAQNVANVPNDTMPWDAYSDAGGTGIVNFKGVKYS